jgi:hypothetical protein
MVVEELAEGVPLDLAASYAGQHTSSLALGLEVQL